jgi:hypothetical protein
MVRGIVPTEQPENLAKQVFIVYFYKSLILVNGLYNPAL